MPVDKEIREDGPLWDTVVQQVIKSVSCFSVLPLDNHSCHSKSSFVSLALEVADTKNRTGDDI